MAGSPLIGDVCLVIVAIHTRTKNDAPHARPAGVPTATITNDPAEVRALIVLYCSRIFSIHSDTKSGWARAASVGAERSRPAGAVGVGQPQFSLPRSPVTASYRSPRPSLRNP